MHRHKLHVHANLLWKKICYRKDSFNWLKSVSFTLILLLFHLTFLTQVIMNRLMYFYTCAAPSEKGRQTIAFFVHLPRWASRELVPPCSVLGVERKTWYNDGDNSNKVNIYLNLCAKHYSKQFKFAHLVLT